MTTGSIPDAIDAHARDAAHDVLDNSSTDGDILALVSGGHDSLTAMHVVARSRLGLDGIVHVNTGVGVPQTRAFIRQRARQLDLKYIEIGSEYRYPSEEYGHLVETYGFPGPAVHTWMYVNLKEKPLERWLIERYPDRECTLVSGVRRHESTTRMENVDEAGRQTYLGATTIAPLVDFTGLDVRRYRSALDLPMNPVVDALEMSGECLCGAYASRGERRMLRLFYPEVHRYLTCLEATVKAASCTDHGPEQAYAKWGHGRFQDREQRAMNDDAQMLLCQSCEKRTECADDGTVGSSGTG